MRWFASGVAIRAIALTLLFSPAARANPASDVLRGRAADELYNLDTERALATWRESTRTDPQDAAAWRGLAGALIVQLAMLRGTMTVDSYLGRVTTKDVSLPPPPAAIAGEFQRTIARAIALARLRVASAPREPHAHYQLGAAVGLRASYVATIDGGVVSAFRAAREAYSEHERVLALDPSRGDAGLIVGSYRYLVSALNMPLRWAAYVAGFGGGRERGIALVERAAAYPGDNQGDARLALLLLYTREGRYDNALAQLQVLRQQYPRNRLFWLEAGSTLLRAKRPAEAERMLNEGLSMLGPDTRPRMFGEDALWYYRRGEARAALGRTAEARADLTQSIAHGGRKWVEGRAHLELGRLALAESDVTSAREHLRRAASLGDSDSDGASAARARALLKQGTRAR